MLSQSLACFQLSSPHRTSQVWCYHQTNPTMSSGGQEGTEQHNIVEIVSSAQLYIIV